MNATLKGDVLTITMQIKPESTLISNSGKTYVMASDREVVPGPVGQFTVSVNVFQKLEHRTGK